MQRAVETSRGRGLRPSISTDVRQAILTSLGSASTYPGDTRFRASSSPTRLRGSSAGSPSRPVGWSSSHEKNPLWRSSTHLAPLPENLNVY